VRSVLRSGAVGGGRPAAAVAAARLSGRCIAVGGGGRRCAAAAAARCSSACASCTQCPRLLFFL